MNLSIKYAKQRVLAEDPNLLKSLDIFKVE